MKNHYGALQCGRYSPVQLVSMHNGFHRDFWKISKALDFVIINWDILKGKCPIWSTK